MLSNVKDTEWDNYYTGRAALAAVFSTDFAAIQPKNLGEGLYLCGGNFHLYLKQGLYEEFFEITENFYSYGVCDSPEQFIEVLGDIIKNDPRRLCVAFNKVSKKDQPEDGGWRWHKWGEYIGNQKPQREYLYDEPNIEEVYCYQVIELLG